MAVSYSHQLAILLKRCKTCIAENLVHANPTLAATTSSPSRRCRWRHRAKPRGRCGGGGPSPAAPSSGSAWILVEFRGMSSLRQNKRAGARSPSRQGHLWRHRRAAGLVSCQICGSGEGGFSKHDRPSTWPWIFWSLFGCRRAADAVAFPSADRGGEGVEGDGTTVFLVRVVYGLF
jgi:hypothetical protein